MNNCQGYVQLEPWGLAFNRFKHQKGTWARIVITSPNRVASKYMCSLGLQCSNNQVEYQALILGLRLLLTMDSKVIKIIRDSQLVVKQLVKEYKCNNPVLMELLELARSLLQQFAEVTISHIP